jgi:hypothetical protein
MAGVTELHWGAKGKDKVMSNKLWFTLVCIMLLFGSGSAMACDPKEGCSKCIIPNIFTGGCSQTGNDPLCEIRKEACNKCLVAHIVQAGTTLTCATCIIGAIASGGAIGPACAAPCGSAAAAEGYAKVSGC